MLLRMLRGLVVDAVLCGGCSWGLAGPDSGTQGDILLQP